MNGENPETRAKLEKIQARIRGEATRNGIKMSDTEARRNLAHYAERHDESSRDRVVDSRSVEEALAEAKRKVGAETVVRQKIKLEPGALEKFRRSI